MMKDYLESYMDSLKSDLEVYKKKMLPKAKGLFGYVYALCDIIELEEQISIEKDRITERQWKPDDNICKTIDEWLRCDKDHSWIQCCECKRLFDNIWVIHEELRSGQAICTGCVRNHYNNKDPGIYPRETGMGIVSNEFLQFTEWSDFFKYSGYCDTWFISEYQGKLYMTEDTEYRTQRYTLIATEKMIQDFDKVIQNGGE